MSDRPHRSLRQRRLRAALRRAARRLPPPRDDALLRLVRSFRDLVVGHPTHAPPASVDAPPTSEDNDDRLVKPEPQLRVEDLDWKSPPSLTHPGKKLRSLYDSDAPATRYDLELLEKLNAEYATKPTTKNPPRYGADPLTTNARRRALWVHNTVDLMGKRTLEVGCGSGFEVWHIAHHFNADAHGVDIAEYAAWKTLADDKVHFTCADLATSNPYPENHFDRVISFTVWEHARHPYRLLQETYRVLRPGGLFWMYANLYAGPSASHRYRDFRFPWPHLIFSDEVIKEWDRKHGKPERGSSWVNRLSWRHYDFYFREIGFKIRHLNFVEKPIDEDFYLRFEDILGRFPRFDLTKDFFLVVLEKPA